MTNAWNRPSLRLRERLRFCNNGVKYENMEVRIALQWLGKLPDCPTKICHRLRRCSWDSLFMNLYKKFQILFYVKHRTTSEYICTNQPQIGYRYQFAFSRMFISFFLMLRLFFKSIILRKINDFFLMYTLNKVQTFII